MTTRNTKNKTTGKKKAVKMRKMGFNATVFKTKKGVKISVTRKK